MIKVTKSNLLFCAFVSTLCSVQGTITLAEEAYLRSQREAAISEVVANACNGNGSVNDKAVHVLDLTMDGAEDFIIDESGITCATGAMSINCGSQVCSSRVFVFENEYYVENLETLGLITKVIAGSPPVIEIYRHGGATEQISWKGQSFQ